MLRECSFRFSWVLLAMIVSQEAACAKPKKKAPPPPKPPQFPTSVILKTGFDGVPSAPVCCQTRIIGWTKEGLLATYSSTFSPDEQIFRYGIDLHDPAFLDPEELFAVQFFAADDTLPEGCADSKEPLRCVWKLHEQVIGETLRKYGVASGDIRMKPLPKLELRTVADPLPNDIAFETAAVSLYDEAGRVTLEMPDSTSRGYHLSPVGVVVRNRPKPARYMVMRFYSRESRDAEPRELGARLLRMPGL